MPALDQLGSRQPRVAERAAGPNVELGALGRAALPDLVPEDVASAIAAERYRRQVPTPLDHKGRLRRPEPRNAGIPPDLSIGRDSLTFARATRGLSFVGCSRVRLTRNFKGA